MAMLRLRQCKYFGQTNMFILRWNMTLYFVVNSRCSSNTVVDMSPKSNGVALCYCCCPVPATAATSTLLGKFKTTVPTPWVRSSGVISGGVVYARSWV